jgi:WD40 repeat protein
MSSLGLFDPRQGLTRTADGRLVIEPVTKMQSAVDVEFFPDGKRLACLRGDGTVFFWDLASNTSVGDVLKPVESRDSRSDENNRSAVAWLFRATAKISR